MFRIIFTLIIIIGFASFAMAQKEQKQNNYNITGIICDSISKDPIFGVNILFKNDADTIQTFVTNTNETGKFEIKLPDNSNYKFETVFLGFEKYSAKLNLNIKNDIKKQINLDTIFLMEKFIELTEYEILGIIPPTQVKGDTIQINSGAYNIERDMNLKDWIKKIPELQIDQNGSIKFGGKTITKILLDGRKYFGNDINTALTSLPAIIIQKLQIYKNESEEAKSSGIKDFDPDTVLNIEVKQDFKKSIFGDILLGRGNKNRYLEKLNATKLHDNNQFALNADRSNINQEDFGYTNDFTDNKKQNLNLSSNIEASDKFSINNNFRLNNFKNADQYKSDGFSSILNQFHHKEGKSLTSRTSSAISTSINWNPDSLTYISANIDLSADKNRSMFISADSSNIVNVSNTTSQNIRNQHGNSYGMSSSLVASRKTKKGRSFTLSMNYGITASNSKGDNNSITEYSRQHIDTLNQIVNYDNNSDRFSMSLRYVEPLSKSSKIFTSAQISNIASNRDNKVFKFDKDLGEFSIVDTTYSRNTSTSVVNYDFSLGYQYTSSKININSNFTVSPYVLKNKSWWQEITYENRKQKALNYSPNIRIFYMIEESCSLSINYAGISRFPTVSQLSADTIIISPMAKTVGNPNLQSTFVHRFSTDFYKSNYDSGLSLNGSLNYNITSKAVVANNFVDDKSNSLSTYSNVNGIYDVSAYGGFNTPLTNRNITIGVSLVDYFSKDINYINDKQNIVKNNTFNTNTYVRFYSDIVETNLSLGFTYSTQNNLLAEKSLSITKNYNLENNTKLKLWKGLSFESFLNASYKAGYSKEVRKSEILWNLAVAKVFLQDKRGKIKFEIYDVLNNYRQVESVVSGSDYSNYWQKAINNYFIISFTYNLDLRNT